MSLALKLVLSPVLIAQAMRTRKRAVALPEAAGPREGQVGSGPRALRILIAGDSSAAGVGVSTQEHAFAGYFTRTLHRRTGRPIRWRLRAKSGLTTKQIHDLLIADPPPVADIAIVLSGVNDVTDLIAPHKAVEHRAAIAEWLLRVGRARYVVFSPLPPIDQFPLLPQPLRHVMAIEARLHDKAIAEWAKSRHNVFHAAFELQLAPGAMARDGFHPAEPIYRASGEAIARFVIEKVLPLERL
jgi:lysophospholipase L1-like esterase